MGILDCQQLLGRVIIPKLQSIELQQVGIHQVVTKGIEHSSLFISRLSAQADGLLGLLLLLGPQLGDVEGVDPGPVEVVLGPHLLPRIHLVISLSPRRPGLVGTGEVVNTTFLGRRIRNI